MAVVLALKSERLTVIPIGPDGTHCLNEFFHLSSRCTPGHAETFGDVRSNLRTKSHGKSTLRVRIQVVSQIRENHWATSKCHRDARTQLDLFAMFRGKQ